MSEYRSLALTILAIFIITLLGAYFSPTFEEQKSYLELFFFLGSLLFIFAIVVIFAYMGFHSFALFLSIFIAMVISLYGSVGAVLVIGMSYFLWGFVFAMEVLLFYHDSPSAKAWFISRYTYKAFKKEYYAFYPMMGMIYLLLERIPHLFLKERNIQFHPSKVLYEMQRLLK